MAHIQKPAMQKESPLTANNPDQPIPIGQREVLSNMGRTRTGIQNSREVWGDRSWGGDTKHPCAPKE